MLNPLLGPGILFLISFTLYFVVRPLYEELRRVLGTDLPTKPRPQAEE